MRKQKYQKVKGHGPLTSAEWNAKIITGTAVRYFPTMGFDDEFVDTVTRTPAWDLCNGEALVSIEGKAGGVSLRHIQILPTPPLPRDEKGNG